MPGLRLRLVTWHICRASPNAYSCAKMLISADGVACCCRTARAPRSSEHTDTGVLREMSLSANRRIRRLA
eukprot:10459138-Alexandrium_andersonii.AAC.1